MTSSNGLVGQVEKLVAAELEKRRKGAPDSGMDVTAWNAANPQHPKDARGRWSDNPAGRAIAQAYSNLRAAPGRDPGAEWVSLADLREEIGGQFTRAEVDSELRRLGAGNGDPSIRIEEETNQKALSMRDRAAALSMGGGDLHVISIEGDLPGPGKKPASGNDLATAREAFAGLSGMDPFSPERMRERELAERKQFGEILQARSKRLEDWSDEDLSGAMAALDQASAQFKAEVSRRKAAKKPKATARLTNKPPKDLSGVADRLRHAPTTEAAQEQLEGLTVADLRAVAAEADVPLTSKMTKQQIKDRLIKQLGGSERTTRSLFPSMESKPQKPATARLTNKPSSDDALAQRLAREGITRAEVEKELEGLKLAELKALAKTLRQQLGTVSTSGTRKDQIKGDILEGLVGFKERARAIFEGSTAGSFDDRFSVVQGGKA